MHDVYTVYVCAQVEAKVLFCLLNKGKLSGSLDAMYMGL
jgi:hypothetical protein